MRVGLGNDVHRLVDGRDLVLGGVKIPYEKGLLGHSDADVLVHAVCDALLGAVGKGDIGEHFPDNDPEFKDIYSIELLERTYQLVVSMGYRIVNIDSTVFAEKPKLSPYKDEMRKKISEVLNISPSQVNIKATTAEGLGMIGSGEGIGAMCIVLVDLI